MRMGFQAYSLSDSKHRGRFFVGVEADNVFPSDHVVVVLDEFMEVLSGRFMDAEFF
jgi:hypothetical protein